MATATMKAYGLLPVMLLNKEIDYLDGTIRATLTNSTFPVDQDTDDHYDDISSGCISGIGNGIILTTKTIGYTAATNVVKLDADDVVVSPITIPDVQAIHIYDETNAAPELRSLICVGDLGAPIEVDTGSLVVQFDSAGMLTLTVA